MSAINKQSIVWALQELASREEQERLLLSDGSSGEVSSFIEAICGVYDDDDDDGGVSRTLNSNELSIELTTGFKDLSKYIDKVHQRNASPRTN